ncbi:hypothetical protein PIB30_087215 [Stylosanthes scabra]|uniref:Uncharacterized protein n=1 Tax=Stylosanthes scabra TaxID=79078 RepID=A0ABU6YSW1_9FABA|nr:hypothetical protein [Stylosanthes scabra]
MGSSALLEMKDGRDTRSPSNRTDLSASKLSPSETSRVSSQTNRTYDVTALGADLPTHEAWNVGNVGLPKFGATVPDIGPGRPKSHQALRSIDPAQHCVAQSINPQRIKI